MPLTASAAMRRLIESWEGCILHAYRDAAGIWTIGYGHTGCDVREGKEITQATADALLSADLQIFERRVALLLGGKATSQQQFDALVSFAYNLGAGVLAGSTLLRDHCAGDYAGAAAQFPLWNHAGGRILAGLTRRRLGEARVYAAGVYDDGAAARPFAGTAPQPAAADDDASAEALNAAELGRPGR